MNESLVDFEINAESQINLAKTFKSFQKKYLAVYTIVMGADWLQGPYLYMLYKSYGLGLTQIATLFLTGFVSSAIAGTAVGSLADVYGRKRVCTLYCFVMVLALVLRLISIYPLLFFSHILSGLSTALLYCVFESWYVSEHSTRGYPPEWRARTFALCTFLNSVSAILAGIISNFLVDTWGYRAPYIAAVALLCTVCSIITSTWSENYGNVQKQNTSLMQSLKQGLSAMIKSRNITVIAIAQTFFECSMYIFVLLYTPSIEAISEDKATVALGYLFSTMMLAVMAGSLVFQLFEQFNTGRPNVLLFSKNKILAFALSLASCAFMVMAYYGQYSILCMIAAYHVFEFTTGLYYPSISSLKAESIPEETRAVIMTLMRIPMNIGVGVIIWQIEDMSTSMMFSLCGVMTSLGCLTIMCFYKD